MSGKIIKIFKYQNTILNSEIPIPTTNGYDKLREIFEALDVNSVHTWIPVTDTEVKMAQFEIDGALWELDTKGVVDSTALGLYVDPDPKDLVAIGLKKVGGTDRVTLCSANVGGDKIWPPVRPDGSIQLLDKTSTFLRVPGTIKWVPKILQVTKPFFHGSKKITKLARDSDGKALTLLLPWVHRITFSSGTSTRVGPGGYHWNFYKRGYIFNQGGNGNRYSQNFDSSPLDLLYIRHHDHAIGAQQTIFPSHFIESDRRVRMRYVAGSTSGYMGTVSATSGDRGVAEGELEFWTEGGQAKFKLNYNKQYVAHNGARQRHYTAAISRSISVGSVRNLTGSWSEIAKFNYATGGGYWAIIYIRKSGAHIEIAQKCDWHGARVEIGAFAILGYDLQG